ncbi:DNA-binding transcriptional LysR family regulator [Massilia sp. UYP32]
MDRLVSMRVFVKVVDHGSFAGAAAALGMSAAVVTRNVADLETHLGTRLLNRTTRRLSLTETGQQYLDRVRQILLDIDDADAAASSSSQQPSGTLRIYCHPAFGKAQLARLLPRFAQATPDVVLDVTLADHDVDLVEQGFDVGIFIGLQKLDASMIVRQLATSNVVLSAAPDYLARRGAPGKPSDIAQHDCLLRLRAAAPHLAGGVERRGGACPHHEPDGVQQRGHPAPGGAGRDGHHAALLVYARG